MMNQFTHFWGRLIFKPREFFEDDFNKSKSPYFLLVLLVYGFSDQLDRMDKQMMKIANGRLPDASWISESWASYIILTILFGLMAGLMYHYLGGLWFNLRVGFCGGEKDKHSSRFIFLYSLFPVGFAKLLFFLPVPLTFDTPMQAYLDESYLQMFTGFIVIGLLFYSLYISYTGAITVFDLQKGRAKFWFMWLPSTFYLMAFGFIIWFFTVENII